MIWLVVAGVIVWFVLFFFGLAIVSMSKPRPLPRPLSRNPNVTRVSKDDVA